MDLSFFWLYTLMLPNKYTISLPNKSIFRFFIIGILSVTGILSGVVPQVSKESPRPNFSSSVSAQEYSPEEVINYAKAGFAVEMLRQQVYTQIKQIIDQPPPNIVCNQPQTYSVFDNNVQQIVVDYCDRSREIVTNNDLSISRFNELKNLYDRGGSFYQQVQNALIQIQRQNPKIVNKLPSNYQLLRINE